MEFFACGNLVSDNQRQSRDCVVEEECLSVACSLVGSMTVAAVIDLGPLHAMAVLFHQQSGGISPRDRRRGLSKILGIRLSDYMTNEEVKIRSEQPPASSMIYKRCMYWFGQAMMLPPTRPAHQALLWAPRGRTRRGMAENELAPDRRSCLSDGVTSGR